MQFSATVPGCITNSCAYTPKIVWTAGAKQRPCGTVLTQSSTNDMATTYGSLPVGVFTPVQLPNGNFNPPNFLVVVDIAYTWSSIVFDGVIQPITFKRTSYLNLRYLQSLTYQVVAGDNGIGQVC